MNPSIFLILCAVILLALTEMNSRFIRIQKLAEVVVSLALVSLWLFFLSILAEPDPYVQIGHVAPFMITLAMLTLAGIWHTDEFAVIRSEMTR